MKDLMNLNYGICGHILWLWLVSLAVSHYRGGSTADHGHRYRKFFQYVNNLFVTLSSERNAIHLNKHNV